MNATQIVRSVQDRIWDAEDRIRRLEGRREEAIRGYDLLTAQLDPRDEGYVDSVVNLTFALSKETTSIDAQIETAQNDRGLWQSL